tara:strand:- start:939 stop:1268 length:330 start_codon:yes stop_codon:yes gene_type:complete
MGATSVTGVGPGSADGLNKGSEHMTLGVGNLIGPKVVVSGTATLVAGAAVVNYGTLSGDITDYVLFLFDATDGGASTVPSFSAFDTQGFTIAGDTTNVINWMVVKIGHE